MIKLQQMTQYDEVGSHYLIRQSSSPPRPPPPPPPKKKQCWNSGSTLNESTSTSTSTLPRGWQGGGEQKDHLLVKVQSGPNF